MTAATDRALDGVRRAAAFVHVASGTRSAGAVPGSTVVEPVDPRTFEVRILGPAWNREEVETVAVERAASEGWTVAESFGPKTSGGRKVPRVVRFVRASGLSEEEVAALVAAAKAEADANVEDFFAGRISYEVFSDRNRPRPARDAYERLVGRTSDLVRAL